MSIPQLYDCFQHWVKQSVYIYSDPHFSDDEMIHLRKNYIGDNEQVKRINSKVGKADTIIILGDVGNIEYIRQLRGYKVLICGNHDAGVSNYKREIITFKLDKNKYTFTEAVDFARNQYPNYSVSVHEQINLSRSPFEYWLIECDNKLFDEVYSGPLMIGEKLILSHEPLDIDWAYNIHGHDHANADRPNHLNCCAECIDYTPISLNAFVKSGNLNKVTSIHRDTIDKATIRSKKKKAKEN